ncbi:hypothetical protein VPH35_129164 [Triticum aestivum]
MAQGGGRRFGWSALVRSGGGFGVWKKSLPVFGSNAVTPASATIPSWRVSLFSIPQLPPRVRENPRTRPGSSVVGVAFLLGGSAWYAADRSLGLWSFVSSGRSDGGSSVLCRAAAVGICFFFFFFWACCATRPSDLYFRC